MPFCWRATLDCGMTSFSQHAGFSRATQSYSAKTCGVALTGSGCDFSEAPVSVKVFRLDQSTAQMLKVAMKMCRFHQKTAQMLKCSMQDGASINAMALEQGSLWLEPDAGLLLFCARRPASSGMPLIFSCTLYNPANRVFCTSVHKCSVIICTPSNPKPRALTCPPAVLSLIHI